MYKLVPREAIIPCTLCGSRFTKNLGNVSTIKNRRPTLYANNIEMSGGKVGMIVTGEINLIGNDFKISNTQTDVQISKGANVELENYFSE